MICLGDKTKIAYLQDVLEQQKIPVSRESELKELSKDRVTFIVGSLLNGFEFPQSRLVVITEKRYIRSSKRKS